MHLPAGPLVEVHQDHPEERESSKDIERIDALAGIDGHEFSRRPFASHCHRSDRAILASPKLGGFSIFM